MSEIRYRTSPALTIIPHSESDDGRPMVGIFEFLNNSFAYCTSDVLVWLSLFKNWKTLSEIITQFPNFDQKSLFDEIMPLVDAKFLAREGSTEAEQHNKYSNQWDIGYPAALFHFSTLNSSYCSESDAKIQRENILLHKPPVALNLVYSGTTIELNNPYEMGSSNLLVLMASRRTNRTSTQIPIDCDALGACLFAGLGVTGFIKEQLGILPLSMTPSGGARNPYEAFVFVRRVNQTTPGLYHYNAISHELVFLNDLESDFSLAKYFGNQDWVDEMAAMVVLVAFMERTSWKYSNGSAYRVVYLEAGHIAQNTMLAATSLGLTVCPTAALDHKGLNSLLGIQECITQTAVYAFSIDVAKQYPDFIIPNKKLKFDRPNS